MIGCEAFARWYHPTRGILPPSEFLDHAAESHSIIDLDSTILTESCRQAAEWNNSRPADAPLRLSANLAARTLRSDRLRECVSGALEASGLPSHLLVLELSEQVIMGELDLSGQALKELRELGVQIAVDDFGTGISSLSHLGQLPVDALKVDRSFVHGPDDTQASRTAVVQAITTLGHALGLRLAVKSIESQQECDVVRGIGVDEGQGYHLGRPVAPNEATWAKAVALGEEAAR